LLFQEIKLSPLETQYLEVDLLSNGDPAHINFFLQISIKEGIFDIQLIKRPLLKRNHGYELAN